MAWSYVQKAACVACVKYTSPLPSPRLSGWCRRCTSSSGASIVSHSLTHVMLRACRAVGSPCARKRALPKPQSLTAPRRGSKST
jgi:hypothetical protein